MNTKPGSQKKTVAVAGQLRIAFTLTLEDQRQLMAMACEHYGITPDHIAHLVLREWLYNRVEWPPLMLTVEGCRREAQHRHSQAKADLVETEAA